MISGIRLTAAARTPPLPARARVRAVGPAHRTMSAAVSGDGENRPVDLARIGWLATVIACLIAVVILALQGYYGYAGVTLAVAISAAINLF
jgi:hypothetical protein